MRQNSNFYRNLKNSYRLYEGCGNMLGIVPLTLAGYPEGTDFRKDKKLREELTRWGRQIHSDSVMVLTGDSRKASEQGYHFRMYVFEPNGQSDNGMSGGVSTMCGNGIRAVAAYTKEFFPYLRNAKIQSESGLREVQIAEDMYKVEMGKLANEARDFASYVNLDSVPDNNGKFLRSPIPEEIRAQLKGLISASEWSIGLTGDKDPQGHLDGEPHVVISIDPKEAQTLEALRELAVKIGPIVTKNTRLFPQEINLNLAVVRSTGARNSEAVVDVCTHERNLGDNADHSVTAACGTGSTVVGGVMFETEAISRDNPINIHVPGGELVISAERGKLFMTGPANKCATRRLRKVS